MAEAFSTVSGSVQVAVTAIRMLDQLSTVYDGIIGSRLGPSRRSRKILETISELPILISLLSDIQKGTSYSSTESSATTSLALQISVDRFKELIDFLMVGTIGLDPVTGQALEGMRLRRQQLVQWMRGTAHTSELQDAVRKFKSALMLLRDISMDHRTHDLLTQQQAYLSYEFDYTRKFLQNKHGLQSPDHSAETSSTAFDGNSQRAEETPAHRFQPVSESLMSVVFSLNVASGDRPQFYVARAKYDTGCPDQLITDAVIRKHKLEQYRVKLDKTISYTALGNVEVNSEYKIHLNWSMHNESKSRSNTFNVVPDSPFEILLGEKFMEANSPQLPALTIVRGVHPKSKEQKKAEADREAEDDRKGAELALQRRRGKTPVRRISGGTAATTLLAALSSPDAGQSQRGAAAPAGVDPAKKHQQDSLSSNSQNVSHPVLPVSPTEEAKAQKQEQQPGPNRSSNTIIGSKVPPIPNSEAQMPPFAPSSQTQTPQAVATVDPENSSSEPQLSTMISANLKPASMETRDSGYATEPAEKPVSPSSNTESATAERGSSSPATPEAKENKAASTEAQKATSPLGNGNAAPEGKAPDGEARKRRWKMWRK